MFKGTKYLGNPFGITGNEAIRLVSKGLSQVVLTQERYMELLRMEMLLTQSQPEAYCPDFEKDTPQEKLKEIKIGDIYEGDIVYKIDDDCIYLVAPASKRFKTNWYEAVQDCKADGYELPSKEELLQIYNLREEIDAADRSDGDPTLAHFVSATYNYVWSSTEYGNTGAWGLSFGDGSLGNGSKNDNGFVVPVRKIKLEDLK